MEKVGRNVEKASKKILEGKLVVFPTETVYGIGANAFDENAVKNIFKAKNRPADNPLIVHISNMDMLDKVAESVGKIERKIMDKFWPGPISIILKKNECIPSIVTAGLDTVSVRMPQNDMALKLIEKSGKPIAAPSANISGKPSGTSIEDIYNELKNDVSYFLDGGISKIGIESTVVKVENEKIVILRPGYITKEDLLSISDDVVIDKNCFNKVNFGEKVLSPGMKHMHYAPNAKCVMLNIENENSLTSYVDKLIEENSMKNICFMLKENNINKLNVSSSDVIKINLGSSNEDVAKNLFKSLRDIDRKNIDVCFIEGVEKEGIGLGIMNRLIRACDYNIIDIK